MRWRVSPGRCHVVNFEFAVGRSEGGLYRREVNAGYFGSWVLVRHVLHHIWLTQAYFSVLEMEVYSYHAPDARSATQVEYPLWVFDWSHMQLLVK